MSEDGRMETHPAAPFTILEHQDQGIGDYFVVQEFLSFKAVKGSGLPPHSSLSQSFVLYSSLILLHRSLMTCLLSSGSYISTVYYHVMNAVLSAVE